MPNRHKNLYYWVKSENWRVKADTINVSGPICYIETGDDSKENWDTTLATALAASRKNIPFVIINSASTPDQVKYIKKICQGLKIYNDVCSIFFTSGTTGNPKPIQCTNEAFFNCEKYEAKINGLGKNDTIASITPLSFKRGFLYFVLAGYLDAGLAYIDKSKGYRNIVKQIIDKRVTFFAANPYHWEHICSVLDEDNIKLDITAAFFASSMKKSTYEILKKRTRKVVVNYGATEFGTVHYIHCSKGKTKRLDESKGINCVGKAELKNCRIEIIGDDKKKCGLDEVGEIVISGVNVSPSLNHIFYTGDLGYLDKDGDLFLAGRKDDLLKIKGQRINCSQLEECYDRYNAYIFGIPADTPGWSEAVCVFETEQPLEQIKKYVESIQPPINTYYRPKFVFTMGRFPLTKTGKIDKQEIKKIVFLDSLNNSENRQKLSEKQVNKKIAKSNIDNKHARIRITGRESNAYGNAGKSLGEIWCRVLSCDGAGAKDNFFKVGGNSLNAMQLVSEIKKGLGVKISLNILFKNPVFIDLVRYISKQNKTVPLIIPKAPKRKYYPLSSSQERMFVQYKLNPESHHYNISTVFRSEEKIDVKQFARALAFLASRHEILRTIFKEVNGQPVQIVSDESLVKLRIHTLTSAGSQEKDDVAREAAIEKMIQIPFDLAQEAPLRATLFRYRPARNTEKKASDILVLSVHHIATDQWSMRILLKELLAVYQAYLRGKSPYLPKLNIQYKDYAAWERSEANQKRLAKQKKYWLDRLGKNPPVTALPLDYPRKSALEYEKENVCEYLDIKTVERLRRIANSHQTSLFMVLFAVTSLYITRLTGKDDVIIGTSVAHRDYPELANLIGLLSNIIPVRTEFPENSSFEELLAQIKKSIIKDYQNVEYPLEKLIDDLGGARDIRNIRLFNFVIHINENNEEYPRLQNSHSTRISNQATNNDWGLIFEVYRDRTRLLCEYNSTVLTEATIRGWTADLVHLIEQVTRDPKTKIKDYEAVSPTTREKLLNQFNNTTKKQHQTKAPHHYFEAQAKKTPHKTAVVYEDRKISYRQLDNEANQLANCLIDKGIKPGDKVAVDISETRYLDIPKAVLASHKVGAGCLIIDREYPDERVGYMLGKCRTKAIISDNLVPSYQGAYKKRLHESIATINISEKLDKYSPKAPKGKGITGIDTAFVVFTSGTTGIPKGIKVTARGMVNEAYHKVARLNTDDIIAIPQNFSFLYNPSLEFICASFVLGKKLVIYPRYELYDPYAVMQRTRKEKMKFIWLTPSVLNSYLDTIEAGSKEKIPLNDLILLSLTGEKVHPQLAKRFYSFYEHITLSNDYGCSEVLTCLNGNITMLENFIKIMDGKATRNQRVYILDRNRKLAPIGAIGEIYISGYGLANGYLGDQRLTRQKFLPHPFIKGERIYRTGDRGRLDYKGNIEVKGRIDDRVKIRGQRVELDEIREKVKKLAGVNDVLIKAWKKGRDYELALVCYYTAKAGSVVTAQDIQSALRREVPQFMIPAYFVELKIFPLNQSGKIDKDSLPKPTKNHLLKKDYVEPITETEKMVAQIWQEVLGVEKISRHDNFFDLGGHSLMAIRLLARINMEFSVDLPLKDIFLHPRFSDFAQVTEKQNKTVPLIIPKAPKRKYYPLSSSQERMFVQYKLNPESHHYNISTVFRSEEKIDVKQFARALAFLASRHEILRTIFKEVNGQPVQIVSDESLVKLRIHTLTSAGSQEKDDVAREAAIEKMIQIPFDLAQEAPLRATLFRYRPARNTEKKASDILVLSVHHIATDQWSMRILLKELLAVYQAYLRGKSPYLPKLNIQYKDYAAWERSEANQKRLAKQKKYWLDRLGKNPPVTALPLDYPRKSALEYEKENVCEYLDIKTVERLRRIANSHQTSLFMVLFAVTSLYITRLTGKDDVIIGTSVAHRDYPELANLIGYLGNDIPVWTRLPGKGTFSALLLQTRKNILDDFQNSEYPLERLVADLSGTWDARNIRLFNANFKINENDQEQACPLGRRSSQINSQAANNDWGLIFEVYRDRTRFLCEYNATVLREGTVRGWITDLLYLIKQVANDPDRKIADYETVAPATREKLLYQFNNTDKYQHPTKAPHHYFEAQAEKIPHKTAVVYEKQKISYGKLNDEANKLANCLLDKGIEKGDTVAVDIGEAHYLNIPQAILAIHKAGAAAVMLDREHPKKRVDYILKKSRTKAIISDNSPDSYPAKVKKKINGIALIDITKVPDKYSPKPPKRQGILGTDTAFLTFTSGTTGTPKGIKITARGLVNEAYNKVVRLNKDNINAVPQNFSLAYNPSLEFISAAFVLGKKLVIYPKSELYDPYEVMKRTEKEGIKFITLTPSVLNSYLGIVEDEHNKNRLALKKLELINLIGEKTYSQLVKRFYSLYDHITLTADGGCSEVLSYSNGVISRSKDFTIINEGHTTRNQQIYIMDDKRKLLPIGAIGEIYVSGYGLANGYIDKKQTKEKFLPHPFRKGETIYRTGDRGRFDQAGNLEIIGRTDDQIKIRGQRVEPAEIAEKIKRIAGIKEVLVRSWDKGKKYELSLVCYYTAEAGHSISADQIQAALRKEVSQYMIPAYFVALPAFPLNRNGKIDKDKLPQPTREYLLKTEYIEPKTETEKMVAQIWRDVLGVKKISRYDNFFDLGGHSLKAIQVFFRINEKLNIDIQLKNIFLNPTLKGLTLKINELLIDKNIKIL